MVRGNIITLIDQVPFKLLEMSLGSGSIISLEPREILDSIIWNVMRSNCYLRKVKGFVKIRHFLRLESMTLYKYVMDI